MALVAGAAAGLRKRARRRIYDAQTSIDSIRTLSWSEFELLIGEAYRRHGYEVIETGGGGADGGIDLKLRSRGETVLVQCKHWKVHKVGVQPIRELFGVLMAEHADRAIFVTSGVYTREAKGFARGKPLQLLDGEELCRLIHPAREYQPVTTPVALADFGESVGTDDVPTCPVCHAAMVVRTAKRRVTVGSQFWGCSTYPRCRGARLHARAAA